MMFGTPSRRALALGAAITTLAVAFVVGLASPRFERLFGTADHDASKTEWMPAPRSPLWTGDPVKPRQDWLYHQRAYPANAIPVDARVRALRHRDTMPSYRPAGRADLRFDNTDAATAGSAWTYRGPDGFTSVIEPTWGRQTGRVRDLAIDPTNTNRLFAGVATGGVWRSTDGGQNWTPLMDDQDSLGVGSVTLDPNDPNTVYVGTGEGNGQIYGVGILKSTNGGNTWTKLGANTFNRAAIVDIAVSPFDSNVLVVCANGAQHINAVPVTGGTGFGIHRSTNGGQSFTQTGNGRCTELDVDPTDANTMYHSAIDLGAQNGIYKSTDGGQNWNLLQNGPTGEGAGRLAMGISSDGLTIYAGGSVDDAVSIFKTTNAGATWTQLDTSAEEDQYCGGQCGYDNAIVVNPSNANNAHFGGVGYNSTDNGGTTFQEVGTSANGGPLHVDHHVLMYAPGSSSVLYDCNDGGCYRSDNNGQTWQDITGSIGGMQPYHLALHPTDPNIMFIGTQDNGTQRRTTDNASWIERNGGDGAFSAIDFNNPQIVYASSSSLAMVKSTNGGDTFEFVDAGFNDENEPRNFLAPFVLSPVDSSTIYVGTNRLWRSTDQAVNWQAISGDLAGDDGFSTISNLAVSAANPGVIVTIAENGMVYRTTNGGTNFTDVTQGPLPGRYGTGVAHHPTDENTTYVTYSGFNEATPSTPGHIFKTTNGGTSWTDVSNNLPNTPANNVAVRPDNGNEVYVATDVGVFISSNGGSSWAKMDNGLPNAPVADLVVNGATDTLAAATFGRGVWTTALSGSEPPPPGGGDCNAAADVLCLNNGRFKVEVDWKDFQDNVGRGMAVPAPSVDSGLFYFFQANNWEMLVKVLDACSFNDRFWVFAAATTNVEYTLTVTDTQTSTTRSYSNPLGTKSPAVTDTDAFATCSSGSAKTAGVPVSETIRLNALTDYPGVLAMGDAARALSSRSGPCVADEEFTCLNQGRFETYVDWRDFQGNQGTGKVVPFGSDDSGIFYFFDANNWEMLVKVLDACDFNNHFWVFAAATTNVEYTLTVFDTGSGQDQTYSNPLGTKSPAITDTAAFATCP